VEIMELVEIMEKMGWRRHTVRGFMAGAMKKAGYTVESFKPEGGSGHIGPVRSASRPTPPPPPGLFPPGVVCFGPYLSGTTNLARGCRRPVYRSGVGSRRSYGGKSPENTTFQKQNRFPPREVGQPSALGGRSFEANAFVMFPARGDAPIARNIDRVRRGRGHRTDRE